MTRSLKLLCFSLPFSWQGVGRYLSAARECSSERAMGEKSAGTVTAFDRITFQPGKMGGRACIRGLRITVGLVVSLIAEGASEEQILRDYPDLERGDIRQALAYAAWLTREEIVSA
jgi:uncharacterized protein (DUF433 family)